MKRKTMVLDAETTGVDIIEDTPVQICWALYDGEEKTHENEIFIQTPNYPENLSKMTGITQEDLDAGLTAFVAAKTFKDVFWYEKPDVVVGHNIFKFDLMIIQNWLHKTLREERFRLPEINEMYDTMMSARSVFGTTKWLKLETLCKKLDIEVDTEKTHNALYDIDLTAKCYFKMIARSQSNGVAEPFPIK
jgi:DNA polymerase III alpha subunit (gram-positive type)